MLSKSKFLLFCEVYYKIHSVIHICKHRHGVIYRDLYFSAVKCYEFGGHLFHSPLKLFHTFLMLLPAVFQVVKPQESLPIAIKIFSSSLLNNSERTFSTFFFLISFILHNCFHCFCNVFQILFVCDKKKE